jgi:hypothetical protein
LQAFLERAANGHRFADAFDLRGELGVGLREFLEGKARNLEGGDEVDPSFDWVWARVSAAIRDIESN